MEALALGEIHYVKDDTRYNNELLQLLLTDGYKRAEYKMGANYCVAIYFTEDTFVIPISNSLAAGITIIAAKMLLDDNYYIECRTPRVIITHCDNYAGWHIGDPFRWVDGEEPPPANLAVLNKLIDDAKLKITTHIDRLNCLENVRCDIVPRPAAKLFTRE